MYAKLTVVLFSDIPLLAGVCKDAPKLEGDIPAAGIMIKSFYTHHKIYVSCCTDEKRGCERRSMKTATH